MAPSPVWRAFWLPCCWAVVVLGEGEGSVELALEQTGEVAGDTGVDMMANLMKMQFEATMSPEVKAALKDDE